MFGIGGFNPISLMATAAFGPVGGIVSQLAMQVFSQFGQQLLQQMGRQAGLPQSQIDFAQADFTSRIGDFRGSALNLDEAIESFGSEVNANPREIADVQRMVRDNLRDIVSQMSESQEFKDAKASRGGRTGGGTAGAPGWMMAMAQVLGEKLDAMADDLWQRAQNMSEKDPSASSEFGVVSQQFSMLMNAVNTSIKAIGEALGAMAKRQ